MKLQFPWTAKWDTSHHLAFVIPTSPLALPHHPTAFDLSPCQNTDISLLLASWIIGKARENPTNFSSESIRERIVSSSSLQFLLMPRTVPVAHMRKQESLVELKCKYSGMKFPIKSCDLWIMMNVELRSKTDKVYVSEWARSHQLMI